MQMDPDLPDPAQMHYLARQQQQQQQQQQQKRPPPQLIVLVVPGWVHPSMMEGQSAESPSGCLAGLRLEEQGPCL
jgi:hypothetical protein